MTADVIDITLKTAKEMSDHFVEEGKRHFLDGSRKYGYMLITWDKDGEPDVPSYFNDEEITLEQLYDLLDVAMQKFEEVYCEPMED